MDKIDVQYVEDKGIEMVNAPEGNRDALAEHAIGLLLSLLNNINRSDKQVRNFIWDREGSRGIELSDKTGGSLVMVTWSSFCSEIKGFDCRILVYDKYKKGFGTKKVEEVSLKKLLIRRIFLVFIYL